MTYSPSDGIVLWELQEQASCFRAVTLMNWNIRGKIYVSKYLIRDTPKNDFFFSVINNFKVTTRLRVRPF